MKANKRANRPAKARRRKGPSAKANSRRDLQDEDLPAYSEDGVDLTLIRWMLSLTPAQRLEFLEQRINEILAIRELNART